MSRVKNKTNVDFSFNFKKGKRFRSELRWEWFDRFKVTNWFYLTQLKCCTTLVHGKMVFVLSGGVLKKKCTTRVSNIFYLNYSQHANKILMDMYIVGRKEWTKIGFTCFCVVRHKTMSCVDTYITCFCILAAQVFCTKWAEIKKSPKLCTILHGMNI